jgi:LysM repeat protein
MLTADFPSVKNKLFPVMTFHMSQARNEESRYDRDNPLAPSLRRRGARSYRRVRRYRHARPIRQRALDRGGRPRATAERPKPDARGIISYPSYQVAVAQRGDTLSDLATRIGADVSALARFNGLQPTDTLREGEIVALPGRVREPAGGPLTPGSVDITTLAGAAIDEADTRAPGVETSALDPAPQQARQPQGVSGVEPVRHKVARGETAIPSPVFITFRSAALPNGTVWARISPCARGNSC